MSAIYGIVRKDGRPIERETIDAMREAMAFWGRDGSGLWQQRATALGHLRTHVTPESQGEQLPASDPAASHLVITADARLDNRDELFDALDIPPAERGAMPDSLLILYAYRRWKEACPERLLGAFAFAIWDQTEQELFCARDHMGFRPFFFFEDARLLVFASDIKGVLAVPDVPRDLDKEAILAFHARAVRQLKDQSLYRDIKKLPAAHTLKLTPAAVQRRKYWAPGNGPEIRLRSNDEYAEMFLEHFQRAIDCRLRSAYPVGTHLSGGLDSSAITVLAARALRSTNRDLAGTFSWSPPPREQDNPLEDERQYIEAVCAQEGIDCQYTGLSVDDAVEALSQDASREPGAAGLQECVVRRAAAARGIRVLLSGWGGDEVAAFNGRGYFAELFLQGRWNRLAREVRLRTQLHGGRICVDVLQRVIYPLLPDAVFGLLRLDIPRAATSHSVRPSPERLRRFRTNVRRNRERPGVRRNQLNLLENNHLVDRIEGWALQGARYGIEYRYPLQDRRIIDFCLGLPPEQFFQNAWKRFMFRNAMTGILPSEVQWNKTKREPAAIAERLSVAKQARETLLEERARGDSVHQGVSFLPDVESAAA